MTLTLTITTEPAVMKHQGFNIFQNSDGFYWKNGGYFETLEECQTDIADWNSNSNSHLSDSHGFDLPDLRDHPSAAHSGLFISAGDY